jgi:hypothetical protein
VWFVEHSEAAGVLSAAATVDPAGVWAVMKPFLSKRAEAARFAVGFADGVLDSLPHEEILEWVAEAPEWRGPLIAEMAAKNLDDGAIIVKLLDRFEHVKGIADTFFGAFVSGSWGGSASKHWQDLASQLRDVAKNTASAGLRRWARSAAVHLDRMAESDRKREEEGRLRDYY